MDIGRPSRRIMDLVYTSNARRTVVFIPLEDLGPENGFFMPLKYGQDVCVDGRAKISFPASGGGTGICFALRI